MTKFVRSTAFLLALTPTAAAASDVDPDRYTRDRWNHSRDTATIGIVVGGLGVATAAAGIALRDESAVPARFMVGTGGLAAASGATVMSVVGLQQRYEFLERSNSGLGAYLSLGLVGLSGVSMLGAVVTNPSEEIHDSLLLGGAALGSVALLPAGMQLAGNAGRFRNRPSVTVIPRIGKDQVGAVAIARF